MTFDQPNSIEPGSSPHDVLRLLFENGAQRQADIAAELHITKSASNQHFRKLADEGYIMPAEEQMNHRGRPSMLWKIKPEGNSFLGILVDAGTVSLTLADFAGKKLREESFTLNDRNSREELLEKLEEALRGLCRNLRSGGGRIIQGYIGFSGTVAADGSIIDSPHTPALNGLNLEKELYARFGLNLYCDGMHYAKIQGEADLLSPDSTTLMLEWGEGVGGTVVSNYQILNWASVPAKRNRGLWNLGHIPVVKDGTPCYCGRRGCLEAYTGGTALLKAHPELHCANLHELIERASHGDAACLGPVRAAAKTIAESLYWLLELFGVDSIILDGAFVPLFPAFESAFRLGLEQMWPQKEAAAIPIVVPDVSHDKYRLGSALIARYFYFHSDEMRKCRGVYHLNREFPSGN